jgi:uncharacterized protein (DUF2062 family)
VAARERKAAEDTSTKLAKDAVSLSSQVDLLKKQLAERDAQIAALRGGGAVAAARGLVPFTLLHLLLTALIAFVLGRYL